MGSQIILVVEDEVLIRMLMAEILRDKGYQVVEAACGDEGIAILLSGQVVDLIITDVRMPGQIDGVALATYSKTANPVRPVVITSTHLPATDAAIADEFISKPYVPSMLLRAIDKLIGQPWHTPPRNQSAL
jgi:CheY-like chemotaxis protein